MITNKLYKLSNGRNFVALRRPPNNDEFTFLLFTELLESITCDFEAYYTWSNPPYDLEKFLKNRRFTKPNVVIGIKDSLDLWTEHNYWTDRTIPGVALLDNMASKFPNTNFVILTSLENIHGELCTAPNIQFVPWGGDLSNQASLYQTLEPVFDKNFDSTKTFISLNRNRRHHRLVLLSYLFGRDYHKHGHITYLAQQIDTQNFDNLLDCLPWEFEERHDSAREAMLHGYTKFYNNAQLATEDYEIYQKTNDNFTNFNQNLRSLYQNSFVEIVSETTFSSASFLVTEKTANSIYACNFPIIISGAGAVAHLRELGLDMFDDIIDHGYDLISNPFDRMIAAIDCNQRLLTNSDYVKQVWKNNQARFQQNIEVANTRLFDWYRTRTQVQFNKIAWNR